MKIFIIAIVFLIIGGIGGVVVGTGLGTAGGLIVGSQAGACFAMEKAKDDGMLTSEQIDKILKGTVSAIKGKSSDTAENADWISSEKDCASMIAKLESGSTM